MFHTGSGLIASNAGYAVVQAGVPVSSITYSNGVDPNGGTDPGKHIRAGSNVAGYLSWGHHSALGATFATNNSIMWAGQSQWWIMETVESNNGARVFLGQGRFLDWFSPMAFGGRNYTHTPVGVVTHPDEPGLGGVNDSATYFGLWAQGKCFAICAWRSRQTPFFQVVGDPLVRR